MNDSVEHLHIDSRRRIQKTTSLTNVLLDERGTTTVSGRQPQCSSVHCKSLNDITSVNVNQTPFADHLKSLNTDVHHERISISKTQIPCSKSLNDITVNHAVPHILLHSKSLNESDTSAKVIHTPSGN